MRKPTRKVSYPEHLKRPSYVNMEWSLDDVRDFKEAVAQKDDSEFASAMRRWTTDKLEARLRGRQDGLLEELFLHYRISLDNQDRWELLAKALAYHHVPAFRFTHRKSRGLGAPKKRTRAASLNLVSAVDDVRMADRDKAQL
jgi:hypothetical protein